MNNVSIVSFDIGIRTMACGALKDGKIKYWSVDDILLEDGCTIKNAKTVTIQHLVRKMHAYLEKRLQLFQTLAPTVVAIEQQPSSRFCPNTKTKVLSHIL